MESKTMTETELLKRLSLLREDFHRNPERAAAARASFMQQAGELAKPASGLHKQRSSTKKTGKTPSPQPVLAGQSRFARVFLSILLAAVFILGTGLATVQASLDSQPDQLLYAVKLASENVALSLTSDPARQFGLAMDYEQNRFSEIMQIIGEGDSPSDKVINRFRSNVERAVGYAAGLSDDKATEALKRLQNRLEVQEEACNLLKMSSSTEIKNAKGEVSSFLGEQIKVTRTGQSDLDWLRKNIKEQKNYKGSNSGTSTDRPTPTPTEQDGTAVTESQGNGNSQATHTRTPGSDNGLGNTKTHTPPAYGQGGKNSVTSTPTPVEATATEEPTEEKSNNGKHKGSS